MTATIIDIDTPNEPKLYQWDTGRTISIDDDCTYVDYVVSGFPGCMRVEVTNRTAQIPNAALTRHGILTIMLVKDNDDGHRTIAKQTEIIEKRAKPDDYIFTDGDYMNWEWIKEHAIEATQEAEETALENIAAAKSAAVAAVNSAATAISTSAESALESAEAASGSAEDAASSAEDAEGYADQARQYAEAAAGTPYNGIVTNWTKLPDALYSKNVNGESSGYKIANSGYNAGFNPGELPYVLKGATVTIDTSGGWTDYDFSPQGAMFTSKGAEVGTYINGSRVNYAAGVRTYTAPCDGYIFVAFRSMTKVNGSYVTLTADDRREILKHVAISGKTIVPDVNYSDVQALKDDTMYTEKSDIGDYSWLIAAEQHESEARHDAPLPNESAMLSNAVAALNSADPQHSMFRISYITDTHIDTEIDNRRQGWMPSVRVFRNLTGYTDIAVHGGDLIQGTKNGHEQAIRNMIAGYRAFDGTNLYITRGNHDCNARTTEGISQKLWGKYFSGVFKSDGFHTRDPECCYGYIDYPDKKIRCAFLNVHELDARSRELNRVSTTQLKYLFGAPDSKTRNASYFGQYAGGATGWTYICFCHTPGHMNQTQLVNKAVAKYIVSQGVKVVFIHGDSHKDMIEYIPYTVNGTTYYGLNLGVDRAFYTNFGDKTTTYTPEYGTEGMYCVDTLAIDTANNTLHEVRAGRRYMAEDLQDDGAELGTVSDGKIKCYKLYDYITQSSGSTGSAASTPFWDNDLLDPGESAPEEEEDAVVEAPEELPEGIPENGYMRYNKHAKILFWVTPAEGQTLQAAYYGHTPRGYFPKETAADLDDRLDAIEGGGDIAYRQDLVNKLDAPSSPLVGKYLKISQVNADGSVVLENVDLPIATPATPGVVIPTNYYGFNINTINGQLKGLVATKDTFTTRNDSYVISKGTLNNVLASPSIMPSLSDTEKLAARQRIGLDQTWSPLYRQDLSFSEESTLNIDLPNAEKFNVYIWAKAGSTVGNYGQIRAYNENGVSLGYISELGNLPVRTDGRLATVYYGLVFGGKWAQKKWDASGNVGAIVSGNGIESAIAIGSFNFVQPQRISKLEIQKLKGDFSIAVYGY